jgi:phosphate transport system permease protein
MVRAREFVIRTGLLMCAGVSILTTAGIVFVLFSNAVYDLSPQRIGADGIAKTNEAFFQQVSVKQFVTETRWTPQFADKHFGILPLICGTLLISGIAALIGLPIGLSSAIYLSEYASPRARSIIKPVLEVLAGIPTVVYGYFALVFVTPYVLRPLFQEFLGFDVSVFNAASAGIVVGIMIIPMISSLSEDVLRSVPRSLREAGYALGSTRFDVSTKVVVPAALSGIIASFLLAIARAIGETMAVTIAAGQMATVTANPFRSVATMTSYIVNVSLGDTEIGSIEEKSIYAVGLTLFVMTLGMNIVSQFVLRRFREVYQ